MQAGKTYVLAGVMVRKWKQNGIAQEPAYLERSLQSSERVIPGPMQTFFTPYQVQLAMMHDLEVATVHGRNFIAVFNDPRAGLVGRRNPENFLRNPCALRKR